MRGKVKKIKFFNIRFLNERIWKIKFYGFEKKTVGFSFITGC